MAPQVGWSPLELPVFSLAVTMEGGNIGSKDTALGSPNQQHIPKTQPESGEALLPVPMAGDLKPQLLYSCED